MNIVLNRINCFRDTVISNEYILCIVRTHIYCGDLTVILTMPFMFKIVNNFRDALSNASVTFYTSFTGCVVHRS